MKNEITLDILKRIIQDTAPKSKTLKRVGLVGSFARNDFTEYSDIDLVFDTGSERIDEAVLSTGLKIKKIVKDQFGRELDVIPFLTILKKNEEMDSLNQKDQSDSTLVECFFLKGYQKMKNDLIWLWG